MQTISSPTIFLLLLLSRAPSVLSCANNRRILHEPFFPLSPPPPVPPTDSNTLPFFPEYPSPPPPPPSTSNQPTFPANLSSIAFPHSHSAPPRHLPSGKLAAAVLLPLLALIVISLSLAFFLRHRRNNRRDPSTASEKTCFFPAHYSSSSSEGSGRKFPAPPPATDFLYVGTLAGSSGPPDVDPPPPAVSPDQKLGSPELRPLPPLSRQFQPNHRNAGGGYSSEEEFYSPGKSSAGHGSTSQTEFTPAATVVGMAAEKFGSQSETLSSTPSYPSSNSGSVSSPVVVSPPVSSPLRVSSPETSSSKSLVFGSNRGDVAPRPSPVAVPIPPLLPTTPSPTERKPVTPSPPSSPNENYSDLKSGNFSSSFLKERNTANTSMITNSSAEDLQSPARNGELSETPVAPPAPSQRKAPPPPPPPPPCGYWESKVRRPHLIQKPGLVSPVAAKKCSVSNFHLENSEDKCETGERTEETTRPKLKPLHWDKVKASSDRAMVWDQLKTSSFQVNEEMIETLFVCNAANAIPKETTKKPVLPSSKQEKGVLDPKKSQNIAILLRALNATKEEVCESLLEGKTENLGTELLEALLKMAPSKEEEHKLREYKDDSQIKLGTAEKFLRGLLDVPFAFKRIDAMLYIANFDSEVNYLKKSFETLEAACEELKSSRLFLKLLEAVLKTGNRMNVGTNRGEARAFKLDTLLKLVDIKGADGKTTLLHFVVQEIIRAEGSRLLTSQPASTNVQHTDAPHDDLKCRKLGLRVVGNLGGELSNVKKAASMDSEVLSSYVSKLAAGVSMIEEVLRLDVEFPSPDHGQQFHEAMGGFMKKAEDGILMVQAQESVAFSLVKEITEYFHGNSAKEEAHPLRIFMVVRDFVSILEQVCKEVGKETDRAVVSSASRFPLPINPSRIRALRHESSEEESSVSS